MSTRCVYVCVCVCVCVCTHLESLSLCANWIGPAGVDSVNKVCVCACMCVYVRVCVCVHAVREPEFVRELDRPRGSG